MNSATPENLLHCSVLFYDASCPLCSRLVRWLLLCQSPPKDSLFFAPLWGETAKKLLPKNLGQQDRFVVFFHHGKIFTHSTAVLELLLFLGFWWMRVFLYFPSFLRDGVYKFLSILRYRIPLPRDDRSVEIFEKNRQQFLK